MTKVSKKVHLLCNAHLDPVWLWEWQEGAAEAVSTFRTAAELCEKDNMFVFNHNEVIIYQWVQEYEPELFARIQKLVKAGKWHIMGGWYLQSDCNMPSGESFVRQILVGREYFQRHFNAFPTTAINFDPFGHSRGLVQILAKSGYDSYLFGRPGQNDCSLPANEFVWIGYDGSEIIGTRFMDWYNSRLGKAGVKIKKRLSENSEKALCLILWGVGNHGGGPSRKDLRDINQLIRMNTHYEIRHSTPENYFKDLMRMNKKLPQVRKSLNPWATGCYTSQMGIKRKMRQLENEIFSLEKMASTACVNGLMEYPHREIAEALRDLLTGQFHDILPGSSVQPVEEASKRLLDHGLEIASRLKAKAFFALSSGQPKPSSGKIPLLVYNHHPYKVRQIVECEFQLPDVNDTGEFTQVHVYHNGRKIPSQVEQEFSNIPVDWRKRVAFSTELEAGQMNRFDCTLELLKRKPTIKLKISRGKIRFKTNELDVVINSRTGLMDQWKVKGKDILSADGFRFLVIKDNADPWGMLHRRYREVEGRFKLVDKTSGAYFSGLEDTFLDSVRVIEDGAVRSVVEAVFQFNHSFICQRYKLPKKGTEIEIEVRVYWNEKNRMLKLSLPLKIKADRFMGQTAYGMEDLPTNGDESVAQKWIGAVSKKTNIALTCINDSIYGCDFAKDELRLTLLRSPAYSCHPFNGRVILTEDRYSPRIDQGEKIYHFRMNAGTLNERLSHIDREALAANETPMVLAFSPSGAGIKPKSMVILTDAAIQNTTVKKAQNNNDYIIRLFEPTGKKRNTDLILPLLKKRKKITFVPFEIKTIRVNMRTGKIQEVDLLEK